MLPTSFLASVLLGTLLSSSLGSAAPGNPAPLPTPASRPSYVYRDSLHLLDAAPWFSEFRGYRKGFLTVGSGGFRWKDGSRARFWGLNIANRNLWITHPEIDQIVDVLSHSGVNLVRFEALDSRGGMLELPQPGSRHVDPKKFDTLHYWIYRLRQKGIHYYLDLIDFRDFVPEDGIENAKALGRAARPYCMFDEHLIALQCEYAHQLLSTVNPYTKVAPVDDPGLAMMEICNESGFFLYPKVTENLVEPYRARFQAQWNAWLRRRYTDQAGLARAWGTTLGADEDLTHNGIRLPRLSKADGPPRQKDGVEFLTSVERQYFATIRDYLRGIGLKIPITAVVSSDVPADVAAVAAELDFTAENHYHDHPAFGGTDWEGKFFYNNRNAMRESNRFGFAPFTAQLRWDAKPVVIREWATVWPNSYRSSSIPEAAAWAKFQDFDGMILFGYKTGAVADRLVEFGYQVDPAVWDLFALGSLVYLRGDVITPSQIALLEYEAGRLYRSDLPPSDLVRLAYSMRLACSGPQGKFPPGDLTVWPVKEDGPPPDADELLRQANLLKDGVYTSVTGQLVRDIAHGLMRLDTPRTCMVAGELSAGGSLKAGALYCKTNTPIGTLIATSLDGEPLTRSQYFLVKMVSVAENSGQKLVPSAPGAPSAFLLDDPGRPPVQTLSLPVGDGTEVELGGKHLLTVRMANGTWEALFKGDQMSFWCDTPDIKVIRKGKTYVTVAGGGLELDRTPDESGPPRPVLRHSK